LKKGLHLRTNPAKGKDAELMLELVELENFERAREKFQKIIPPLLRWLKPDATCPARQRALKGYGWPDETTLA
jgi:hypothetical protein